MPGFIHQPCLPPSLLGIFITRTPRSLVTLHELLFPVPPYCRRPICLFLSLSAWCPCQRSVSLWRLALIPGKHPFGPGGFSTAPCVNIHICLTRCRPSAPYSFRHSDRLQITHFSCITPTTPCSPCVILISSSALEAQVVGVLDFITCQLRDDVPPPLIVIVVRAPVSPGRWPSAFKH